MTSFGISVNHDFGSLQGTEVFLENYCRTNPLKSYLESIINLTIELKPDR